MHAITYLNPENVILSERRETQNILRQSKEKETVPSPLKIKSVVKIF